MINYPELIHKTLEAENVQRKPGGHNPSSASFLKSDGELIGTDLLTQWLKWNDVPYSNPISGADLFKMRLGDAIHYATVSILKKNKDLKILSEQDASFLVGSGKKVPALDIPVTFRLDCLVNESKEMSSITRLALDGTDLVVLELKSTQTQVMYGSGWGIKYTGPKPEHLLQVICYLELAPWVKAGALIYIDRATGGMLQFEITRKPNGLFAVDGKIVPELCWVGIVDRWKKLEGYIKSKKQPPIERSVWLNDKTGEVMDVKTIKGKQYKSAWQHIYSGYRDYLWKNPANYKYTENAKHGIPVPATV